MSLYQCPVCGCRENTACGHYHSAYRVDSYNWEGIEDRKGKKLCSVCGPTKYSDGKETKFGKWHNRFERVFYPKGSMITNEAGNLEHKDTGETGAALKKYESKEEYQ